MSWWTEGLDDLRLSGRMAQRQPRFVLLVVTTLALGIGVTAAAFAALDRAVLRPMPFPEGDRLAFVSMFDESRGYRSTPPMVAVERWRTSARTLLGIGGYQPASATYLDEGTAELLPAANVSANLPALLRLRPVVGRVLGSADLDPAAPAVVMVSESFWRTRLSGTGTIGESSLRLGDRVYQVIGVWPQQAQVHPRGQQADVFFIRHDRDLFRSNTLSYAVARLLPNVTHGAATLDLGSHLAGLDEILEGWRPSVSAPAVFLNETYQRGLWLVFGAASLLLCVAIGNATSLLLARAVDREREIGLRLALGSSTGRLVRQFLAEGAALAVPGAVLAVGVAWGAIRLIGSLAAAAVPQAHFDGISPVTFLFAAAGALVSTIACGLVPLLLVRAKDVRAASVGDGGHRIVGRPALFWKGAVGVQAAIGVVLLAAAALMGRSVLNLTSVDVGFAVRELVQFSLALPTDRYPTPEAQSAFMMQVRDAVGSLPGVAGVTTSGSPFFAMTVSSGRPYLDGEPPAPASVGEFRLNSAAPGYFEVMGIGLRAGRHFIDGDTGVALVNESFARGRGGDVLGRQLFLPRGDKSHDELVPLVVIGVVADTAASRPVNMTDDDVQVWLPGVDRYESFTRFFVRTTVDPGVTLVDARKAIATLDSRLPVREATTGADRLSSSAAEHRLVAIVLTALAGAGLTLAVAGLYGSVVIDVRRRTREVGVRVALGATSHQVVSQVLGRGLRPVLLGVTIGTLVWFWASEALSTLLFRVDARDPISTASGVVLLVGVAVLACVLPARRASRVDPASALRSE